MAMALPRSAFLLREVHEHEWRFFRAVMLARCAVALSLGALLPMQRSLHGPLFPAIVGLWCALAVWVVTTTFAMKSVYELVHRAPRWLWVEEATVSALLVAGGGFRNVFYFYGGTPIVLAAVFVSARMALVLAGVNSAVLAASFGGAYLTHFDPAIEHARFTEWWGAIVGYFVAGFLFAYLRTLLDRITVTAEAYERQAVQLAAVEREAATLRVQKEYGLTAREVEVLALIAAGLANKEIADLLVITEQSVKNHARRLFAKLGVGNRAAAALVARREGLAE